MTNNIYNIKSGDTMWAIVKKQLPKGSTDKQIMDSVNKLAQANNIADPNKIYAGKTLDLGIFQPKTDAQDNTDKVEISTTPAAAAIGAAAAKEKEAAAAEKEKEAAAAKEKEAAAAEKEKEAAAAKEKEEAAELKNLYEEFETAQTQALENETMEAYNAQGKGNFTLNDVASEFIFANLDGKDADEKQKAYKDALVKLAQGEIEKYDTGSDNKLSKKEFIEEQVEIQKKRFALMYSIENAKQDFNSMDWKMLMDRKFATMDVNNDDMLDEKELSVQYMFLDLGLSGKIETANACSDLPSEKEYGQKYNEFFAK